MKKSLEMIDQIIALEKDRDQKEQLRNLKESKRVETGYPIIIGYLENLKELIKIEFEKINQG